MNSKPCIVKEEVGQAGDTDKDRKRHLRILWQEKLNNQWMVMGEEMDIGEDESRFGIYDI